MKALERFSLQGRIALVTGASSGIGAVLAHGLAGAGAAVVLAARRQDRIQELATQIAATGARTMAVSMDVTNVLSIVQAFDAASSEHGLPDIIINNAGVAEPKRFLDTARSSVEKIMNTNFYGAWDVSQEAARRLVQAQQPGCIVNVASVLGLGAAAGYAAYSASKGALIQLTHTLAIEFVRHRIRVNAIAPGWFVSEMNQEYFASDAGREYIKRMPARRTGELQELVGPILLLVSDAGSFINGAVLPVDGGHHCALI